MAWECNGLVNVAADEVDKCGGKLVDWSAGLGDVVMVMLWSDRWRDCNRVVGVVFLRLCGCVVDWLWIVVHLW